MYILPTSLEPAPTVSNHLTLTSTKNFHKTESIGNTAYQNTGVKLPINSNFGRSSS